VLPLVETKTLSYHALPGADPGGRSARGPLPAAHLPTSFFQ